MSASKQRRDVPPIDEEIRELVRHEATRQEAAGPTDGTAIGVANIIQRVASTSVTEIERLIAELTQVREHLQNEAKRIESDIAGFAQMGHVAANSIREISQTLAKFKRSAGAATND